MIRSYDFEQTLKLETERLCLDFTNTVNWHASERPIEELPAYDDLVSWAQKVGLLSAPEAQRLKRQAGRRPAEAEAVLERAHTLREAIYRLLAASAHEHDADAADLDLINAELPLSLAHSRLAPTSVGYGLLWKDEPDALDRMLWPVAYSAADLLTQPDLLSRVGECADDRGCGYLFLDMTKNRSRRWCDMKDCGNRAKARRHYEKQKEAKE
jgi:predicted RNA-binding Zn ribbon-like protein